MILKSSSSENTKKLANKLARKSLKTPRDKALIFALQGNLGSGKTTFVQGFAKGLGIKHFVPSPTFLIMRAYDLPKKRRLYQHVKLNVC